MLVSLSSYTNEEISMVTYIVKKDKKVLLRAKEHQKYDLCGLRLYLGSS